MDYEALPEVSEAMVTLAAIRLMLHRLARPNRRRLPAPWLRKRGLAAFNLPYLDLHWERARRCG
jgi:hypothetical protein